MLRADLIEVGIDPEDNGSGKLDFHALRHTFGTLLAASGVHPKAAQDLMRHSDINLTMSRYTHTLRGQKAEAIDRIPDFSSFKTEAVRKTGTDDIAPQNPPKSPPQKTPAVSQQLAHETMRSAASPCDENNTDTENGNYPNSSLNKEICETMQGNATPCENRARQDSDL